MLGHTRKHRTEKTPSLVMKSTVETPMSIEEFINDCFGNFPQWAIALRGLRNREGLTQAALGEALGTAQTNISKMELGKRPIGKQIAKKLADFFKTDYRIFL